jgi:molecular chaperone HtpG
MAFVEGSYGELPAHSLRRRARPTRELGPADLANLLLEQAEITAGAQLADPAGFVQRMNRVLLGNS